MRSRTLLGAVAACAGVILAAAAADARSLKWAAPSALRTLRVANGAEGMAEFC